MFFTFQFAQCTFQGFDQLQIRFLRLLVRGQLIFGTFQSFLKIDIGVNEREKERETHFVVVDDLRQIFELGFLVIQSFLMFVVQLLEKSFVRSNIGI